MSETKRTYERLARFNSSGYVQRARATDGSIGERPMFARLGEPIICDARELARLESLGAVAPEGWTLDDLKLERQQISAAYRAARQHHSIGVA